MTIRRRSGALGIGWALGIFVAFVGIGLLALRSELGQTLFGGWSFVRSIAQDQGIYYRLKVKLTYKGEPQDFDIVVGCNVRRITYKEGSGTYEAGLIPSAFGRRMSDGKGLVVRPPNACQGETMANGRIHSDLMPIIVVYDNADTLDFGTAYLTDDAYESPLSVLTFGGAKIDTATRKDFDSFRKAQANLVSREAYWSRQPDDVLKRQNIQRASKEWAHICEGYKRFRIPDTARLFIQEKWPTDRPAYWVPSSESSSELISSLFAFRSGRLIQTDREGDVLHPTSAFKWPSDDAADFGAMRRTSMPGGDLAASYYPASTDYRADLWPTDHKDWPGYSGSHDAFADAVIKFQDTAARGFAYCYVPVFPGTQVAGEIDRKRIAARIDGHNVPYTGGPIGVPPNGAPGLIFERDEYVFSAFRLYLESTRGDV